MPEIILFPDQFKERSDAILQRRRVNPDQQISVQDGKRKLSGTDKLREIAVIFLAGNAEHPASGGRFAGPRSQSYGPLALFERIAAFNHAAAVWILCFFWQYKSGGVLFFEEMMIYVTENRNGRID